MAELSDREIDALIAEKVMMWRASTVSPHGLRWFETDDDREAVATGDSKLIRCWQPTADISAAMEVVAHLESQGYQWQFARTAPEKSMHDNKPTAQFWKYREGVLQGIHRGTADTLQRAICFAALEAVKSTCDHSWVDATNEVVSGTAYCSKCGKLKSLAAVQT